MKEPVLRYIISVFVPYLVRIALYRTAFKIRSIACMPTNLLVISGGFILAGLLSGIPFLRFLLALGVPIVLVNRYTDASPADTFGIAVVVELVAYLGVDYLIMPLIF